MEYVLSLERDNIFFQTLHFIFEFPYFILNALNDKKESRKEYCILEVLKIEIHFSCY